MVFIDLTLDHGLLTGDTITYNANENPALPGLADGEPAFLASLGDFVVDIDKVLNSDQYLWTAEVLEARESNAATNWNSAKDFQKRPAPQLTAWEQLAQALLCSNEFLFVD